MCFQYSTVFQLKAPKSFQQSSSHSFKAKWSGPSQQDPLSGTNFCFILLLCCCYKTLVSSGLGIKEFVSAYSSISQFNIEGNQVRNSEHETGGSNQGRDHGGVLLSDVLPLARSVRFLTQARLTCPEMVLLTVVWTFPHQSFKKIFPQTCQWTNSTEAIHQLRFPLPR